MWKTFMNKDEKHAPGRGVLYVCATPIGNLEDVTVRLLRVLREVELVAAEDTRTTRKLLSHYDIHVPMTSCHQHTTLPKVRRLIDRLRSGDSIALVSNAGTPGISDPGLPLVSGALESGITVVPLPGPSAVSVALSAAGLPADRFFFQGFLPSKRGERRARLQAVSTQPETLVFYEAPHRLAETLRDALEILGDRDCTLCRELTKQHEEVSRGLLSEFAVRFSEGPPRGECTFVVAGHAGNVRENLEEKETQITAALREYQSKGLSRRDAILRVAGELRMPKRTVYQLALEVEE